MGRMGARVFTYIDIFSGCGGMSLGLYKAGWTGLFAIEKNRMAFETLKHNLIDKKKHFKWPTWLPVKEHDIDEVLRNYKKELIDLRGKVDLIVGGPPCQGFSTAGKRIKGDSRNKMVDSYIEFIDIVRPRILFFENVKGFTMKFNSKNSKADTYSSYVLNELGRLGYNVHGQILDFSKFGVPQRRRRFILVGMTDGDPEVFFNKIIANRVYFLKKKNLKPQITVNQALSDLRKANGEVNSVDFKYFKEGLYSPPRSNYQKLLRKGVKRKVPDSHRFPNHDDKTSCRFSYILENCVRDTDIGNIIKQKFALKKRCIVPMDGGKVSPTLTTLPDDYIHYCEPRILTVREYARLQAFDDWFEFQGKYTTGGKARCHEVPRYTQVGNAIPPLFGEQSGVVLKEMLK
jgi:DNA (cytosine-5)-methyltransferase 1